MKAEYSFRFLIFAVGLAVGAAGCANQRGASENETRYQNVTGSYLPQNVQKNGPVTNGKDNLRIIDESEIQSSGGADLNQALRQLGANH